MIFKTPEESHAHSLQTLNALYEYDDFMLSINTLADMGCGTGLDLEWWATRTTRDEVPVPLNIKCTGYDLQSSLPIAHKHRNIQYTPHNFEEPFVTKTPYDIVWSHDALQYSINPLNTLANWWDVMSPGGMLAIVLPQTTNVEFNEQAFIQRDFCYFNWTIVSLMHSLAVCGFDCADGYFLKNPNDPWLHAVVYKSDIKPLDPRTTTWYNLCDLNLLPETVAKSAIKYGYVRQQDLVLPWVDKSLAHFGHH